MDQNTTPQSESTAGPGSTCSAWLGRVEGQVLNRYGELFPNYAWVDGETAIDLMAAEIVMLRHERDRLRARFRHMHVGPDDRCASCGFDIRDLIHTRSAAAP